MVAIAESSICMCNSYPPMQEKIPMPDTPSEQDWN